MDKETQHELALELVYAWLGRRGACSAEVTQGLYREAFHTVGALEQAQKNVDAEEAQKKADAKKS